MLDLCTIPDVTPTLGHPFMLLSSLFSSLLQNRLPDALTQALIPPNALDTFPRSCASLSALFLKQPDAEAAHSSTIQECRSGHAPPQGFLVAGVVQGAGIRM